MRRKLLIGLLVYLTVGVAFGFVTDRPNYTCAPSRNDVGVSHPDGDTLVALPRPCFPIISTADRLQWVATTSAGWLPLVIRNVAQGGPIQIGPIYFGDAV